MGTRRGASTPRPRRSTTEESKSGSASRGVRHLTVLTWPPSSRLGAGYSNQLFGPPVEGGFRQHPPLTGYHRGRWGLEHPPRAPFYPDHVYLLQ